MLTGHVVGSTIRTLVGAALVLAVALLLGFRPTGDPLRWLGVAGLLALLTLALTWLGVAVGLAAKTAEGTAPFTLADPGAAVPEQRVRPAGRRCPAPVRWFAANEPFTPDHRRAARAAAGHPGRPRHGMVAVGWCVGLALAGYCGRGRCSAAIRADPGAQRRQGRGT